MTTADPTHRAARADTILDRRSLALGAGAIGVAMAAVVGGALAFEHWGGYIPCALCLQQRVPYYVGAPVMLAAALLALAGRRGLALAGIVAGGLLMAYAAYLGVYHAGAEWGFWPGPTDCGLTQGGVAAMRGGDVLSQLDATRPPACDEAAGRFLGLSFAGWQVVAALGLIVACLALLARGGRLRPLPRG